MRWLACLLLLQATQAAALSCMPPDPVRSYLEVDASPDRWGAVVGRLDFDERRLPQAAGDPNAQPAETHLRAQLVGHSLGPDGFKKPFQGNVALYVQCFGPWCGRPVSGRNYLVFLKREPHRHVAFADPCGARLFPAPTRAMLDALHKCFVGGGCAPEPLE